MAIEMQISRVLMSETHDTHFVELREAEPAESAAPRSFPIQIGYAEAAAIERRLLGQSFPRPLTHDLLDDVVHTLGFRVDRITITELRDHTFHAKLHLRHRDIPARTHAVDARPSDAIAVGAAHGVPIFAAERVLDAACPASD